ncbi:HAMP domain-containing histidine kinase [Actinospica sp. MGRD01-02]|uniref:histidine kinase n=1 Tax=Actinospica acidithermotolerans TaxID=2828514 RepID=A0A941IHC7_9ACTN|nr:HAMP domain-containing sensor histidine kinase [Actinospica acidithermotolerans]MBR7828390.1 HAMP domain-containing histidine kinase [Actinospica acidithermotolerans]
MRLRLWSRIPLWARLVLGTLGLAAVGLSVTGAVGVNLFRDYLVDQSGQQLTTVARTIAGAHWDKPTYQSLNCGSLPSDNAVELLTRTTSGATALTSCSATVGQSNALPTMPSAATLEAAAESGSTITESSTVGGAKIEWQIVVVSERYLTPFTAQAQASASVRTSTYGSTPPADSKTVADGYVLVATPLSSVDATVAHLDRLDISVDIAVGFALLGVGYVLVRRTLRPLREIEAAAAAISAGDLARRIPHGHPKTEIGQLSKSLNGMLGQIEAAFGAQARSEAEALRSEAHMRQFAADAGHELRTPLASIRGLTEIYRQGAVDARQTPDLMRRIEDEATRMGVLVEDLLLLARLDQQRPLAHDRVHLVALAADSITAARARTADRTIELAVERPSGSAEPVVTGDENRLRQAVDNLLTNAVRHTPDDTPITVRVRPDEQPGRYALDVLDTGQGLSPADAARVFERFYRADPSRARTTAQQGSGLGLAIVAAIAEAHGGTATVRTEPGAGACFTLSLPMAVG